jgi:hypothetical protein
MSLEEIFQKNIEKERKKQYSKELELYEMHQF